VLACRPPPARQASAEGHGTVALLGVPHDGTPSRRGWWVLTRRAARTRLRRPKKSRWRWGRRHRHAPLNDQDQRLGLKVRGPCRSDGIRGHCRRLEAVRRDAATASQASERLGAMPAAAGDRRPAATPARPRPLSGLAGPHRDAPEWCRDAGDRGPGGVHRARTGLWGGRWGNHRLYPEADTQ
jgi:hypothetical protein